MMKVPPSGWRIHCSPRPAVKVQHFWIVLSAYRHATGCGHEAFDAVPFKLFFRTDDFFSSHSEPIVFFHGNHRQIWRWWISVIVDEGLKITKNEQQKNNFWFLKIIIRLTSINFCCSSRYSSLYWFSNLTSATRRAPLWFIKPLEEGGWEFNHATNSFIIQRGSSSTSNCNWI